MNILHLHSSIAQKTGGQTVMMSQIINVLNGMGHKNIIITSKSNIKDSNLFYGIDVLKISLNFVEDDSDSSNLEVVENAIYKNEIDLIFIHYVRNTKLLLKLLAISKSKSIPIIRRIADPNIVCFRNIRASYFTGKQCDRKLGAGCLLRGHFIGTNSKGKLRLINIFSRLSEIKINKRFDIILVNSNYMKQLLVQHNFSLKKIYTVSNLVEFNEKLLRTNNSSNRTKRSLLFVGNIHKTKGIFYLLEAMKYINNKVVLRIVGDGKHLSIAKKKASKIKNHEINFIDYVQHDDIWQYYDISNIIVLPSLWPESFGLVGIEALYAGKPVIALNVGGISDWMENNKTGYLLDRNTSPKVFAERIDYLLKNPSIANGMGEYGHMIVRNKFKSNIWHNELLIIFNRLGLNYAKQM